MVAPLRKLLQSILRAQPRLGAFLRRHWRAVLAAIIVLALIGWAAYLRGLGYAWADWTGLGSYVDADGKLQREKTLWDWLQLLVIPLVLAIGGWLLAKADRINEQKIEADRQREAALHSYIEKISELLLNKDVPLLKTSALDVSREVARTRTIITLRILDSLRKRLLLQFIYETGLINRSSPVIRMMSADLRGADLRGIWLLDANLEKVNMGNADFRGSQLDRTSLRESNLCNADMRHAKLIGANLEAAEMAGADLRYARMWGKGFYELVIVGSTNGYTNLRHANLQGANLESAWVHDWQLAEVASLEGAIMPDGKKYDPAFHKFDISPSDSNEKTEESQSPSSVE